MKVAQAKLPNAWRCQFKECMVDLRARFYYPHNVKQYDSAVHLSGARVGRQGEGDEGEGEGVTGGGRGTLLVDKKDRTMKNKT